MRIKEVSNINGYEKYSHYYVMDDGRILSTKRTRPHALSPADNKVGDTKGYLKVNLSQDGKVLNEFVHRLVALAFVDGYEKGLVVDHIDEDTYNNHYENLQFITQKENTIKANAKKIYKLSLDGKIIKVYKSKVEALKEDDAFSNKHIEHIKGTVINEYLFCYEDGLDYNLNREIQSNRDRVIQLTKDMNIVNIWNYASQAENEGTIAEDVYPMY